MLHIKLGETPTAPKWRSSVISTICSKKSSAIMMTPALGGSYAAYEMSLEQE